MKPMTIMKGGCVFLYIVLTALTFGCLLGYWRNVHTIPEEFDVKGKKVTIAPDPGIDIVTKMGIMYNCIIPGSQIDCVWPEHFSFDGDIANLCMVCLALIIYIFTGAAMAVSIINDRFIKPNHLFVLPFATFAAEILLAGTLGIFLLCYRTVTRPKFSEYPIIVSAGATSLYAVNGDYITGPLFGKVSYGEAFYLCIAVLILGIVETAASGFVAYICITEADKAEVQKANAGYVVQQKVVKKQVIETPEVEYEEVEEVQQQQQVAEEDENVESAKVVRKPVKKAKKVQKPQRKSKPSINTPVKKKKKIQSGSQQSEVKVDDESKKSKSEKPLSSLKSVSQMKVESDRSRGKKRTKIKESDRRPPQRTLEIRPHILPI